MCEECTDVSNKEQLTFCIRWVNNDLEVSENFQGFYEIPNIKTSIIVTVMKDILLSYQLNLDVWKGQCYYGASSLFGKSSSVATQIFAGQPKTHYTHCHAHLLSLSKISLKILRF